MNDNNVPFNIEDEQAFVGWTLNKPSAIDQMTTWVLPQHLHHPTLAAFYQLVIELHDNGQAISEGSVLDAAAEHHVPITRDQYRHLYNIGLADWKRYAKHILRDHNLREVRATAHRLDALSRSGADLTEATELFQGIIADYDAPTTGNQPPTDMFTMTEFLTRAAEHPTPWVVPGLFRRGWRVMVVGVEGSGKSELLRQAAITAAQGIHPFNLTPIPPVRTLLIDLENPEDVIAQSAGPLVARAQRASDCYDDERFLLWSQPGGIDLRSARDRAALEQRLAWAKPDLVCCGPVYKMYSKTAHDSDEDAVKEVQDVLDRMRTRHGFALLLEAHAAKGQPGARDLQPFGSSAWLRWPEIGCKLLLDADGAPKGSLTLGRFRHDRVTQHAWPARLDRGMSGDWSWLGYWPNGMSPASSNGKVRVA